MDLLIVFGGAFFRFAACCLPLIFTSTCSSVDFALFEAFVLDLEGWGLFFAAVQVFQPSSVSIENFRVDVRYVPANYASPVGCSDFFKSSIFT